MSNTNQRKASLETRLSSICKVPVEITVRSLTEFTLSAEGDQTEAMEKAKAFLMLAGKVSQWSVEFDSECEQTCAWFTVQG